ncbi:MAG: ABC transporter ATP-binding protein [Candidatus Aminicenantales bacterium]
MAPIVVETRGLSKSYADLAAVSNLNLTIEKGEMLCLVGPDGVGKTTAIRMLSGIIRPTSGTARMFGYDLGREIALIKPHIGYMSQTFTLYGDLTVDENIEFFAEIHMLRRYRDRREELLAFTRLTPFRRRLAEKLSGGMKQKLALACTLIHRPDLLLLDEPTTGVDVVSRREFWQILQGLLQTGITILMTTPYLDEAERANRVALMDHGTVVVADSPVNVKALLKHPVIEAICAQPRRAAAAVKGMLEVMEVQVFGDRLQLVIRDLDQGLPAIERRLEARGISLERWQRVPPSLENVFISLTRADEARP